LLPQRRMPDFQAQPADDFVRTLSDAELVDKCVQGFRKLRELIPYLREARRRWAQPGRQVTFGSMSVPPSGRHVSSPLLKRAFEKFLAQLFCCGQASDRMRHG
jgi:hypothetical protein